MTISKWDKRFLDLAKYISTWSKDPSTQVGAVIADGNRIVSHGYNGLPQGIEDDGRLNDRDLKLQIIVHAEENALIWAREKVEGYTLYTYPFLPCPKCTGIIIQHKISKVIAPACKVDRWKERLELSKSLLAEANIEYMEVK